MDKKVKDLIYRYFWTDQDIQVSLRYLTDNPTEEQKIIDEITKKGKNDTRALIHCIKSGYYETFSRYDSDVKEQYVDYFTDLFLDPDHIKCPDGVVRTYREYRYYIHDIDQILRWGGRLLTQDEIDLYKKSNYNF